jgi:streptomycin 6-kinase
MRRADHGLRSSCRCPHGSKPLRLRRKAKVESRLASGTAQNLLHAPQDLVVLPGDIHHINILDFGPRGWLGLDPKGLLGERGFDFANIFCNPDFALATAPGRLVPQATIVAEAAGLERNQLLQWILSYAGLSAVWTIGDGDDPTLALAAGDAAAAELGKSA